jgi:UDP-N-acetylmuramoylalanine--D-glutamate ligase
MNEYGFNYKNHDIAVSLDVVPEKENRVYIQDDYIYYNEEKLMNIHESMNLKGIHNINNIMFILGACKILDLDIPKAINSIKEFKPLEHRMEFVGNINGVDYYNDSIATIPESTIDAIEAIGNINTIIVGGNDRGIPLVSLIEYLKKSDIENIICLPKTGEYIRDGLEGSNKNVIFTEKLEEAVKISKEITKKNTVCLLSPAASSYGYFKNFEERGKLFKQYVLEGNLHNK